MTDPILYLSMVLGLGGVYVLIASFNDDDDDSNDDGEKYFFNLEHAKAAKDARIRAEAIALQAGSEVDGLKKVNTGVFQITVPNSTRVSSWGSYDTTTIKKDITAVMGVTFAVK